MHFEDVKQDGAEGLERSSELPKSEELEHTQSNANQEDDGDQCEEDTSEWTAQELTQNELTSHSSFSSCSSTTKREDEKEPPREENLEQTEREIREKDTQIEDKQSDAEYQSQKQREKMPNLAVRVKKKKILNLNKRRNLIKTKEMKHTLHKQCKKETSNLIFKQRFLTVKDCLRRLHLLTYQPLIRKEKLSQYQQLKPQKICHLKSWSLQIWTERKAFQKRPYLNTIDDMIRAEGVVNLGSASSSCDVSSLSTVLSTLDNTEHAESQGSETRRQLSN